MHITEHSAMTKSPYCLLHNTFCLTILRGVFRPIFNQKPLMTKSFTVFPNRPLVWKLALFLIFIGLAAVSHAQISSTFTNNGENWTVSGNGFGNGAVTYNAGGGNPGGCVSKTDVGPGETWYFVAPAQFLGNKSWAYGGTYRYQLRQSTAANPFSFDDFIIESGATKIVYDFAFDGATVWTDFAVPITEFGWHFGDRNGRLITRAEMLAVLCNITAIRIRGEYSSNVADVGYLDNFIVDATRCLRTANLNYSICNGQSVVANGRTYRTAGVFRDSISRCFPLCDSILNITIRTGNSTTRTQNVAICEGQSYRLTTRTYTLAGVYQDTFKNANVTGCDSIVRTNLTVIAPLIRTQDVAICPSQTLTVGTNTYSGAGTYRDTLKRFNGCDSIVITNLTIQTAFTRTQVLMRCQGETVQVGTKTYNTTGIYRDTFRAVAGCDSIVVTNLTINPIFSRTQTLTICQGQNVRVGTRTYTTTGTYRDTLRSISNCDSIILTNLTVNPNSTRTQNVSICQGQSLRITTRTYTTSGLYRDTLRNFRNCDSIITTFLTVIAPLSRTQNISICPNQTFTVGTRTYSTAGTYRDTFRRFNGCDSIIVTNLSIQNVFRRTQTFTICQGQGIRVGTKNYTATGVYRDTFQAVVGCDSIVETNLTVRRPLRFNQSPSICLGVTFRVGSKFYTQSGLYIDTLQNLSGCDSIVTTNLTVIQPKTFNQTRTICEGDSLRVGTSIYKTSGSFRDVIRAVSGCDSVIFTTLTVTTITGSVMVENAGCIPNGTATLSATTSSTNALTYKWSHSADSSDQVTGLAAGTYRVTATSGVCSKVFTAIVRLDTRDLNVDSVVQNPKCYGFKDGKIQLRVTGGKRPISFRWNDGAVDSLKENIPAGEYSVVITDANSCKDSMAVVLTQPDSIELNIAAITTTCSYTRDGSITLSNVRGGVAPYTYALNGNAPQKTLVFNKLFASAYQLKVRDSIGCELTKEIELVPPPELTVFAGRDTAIKLGDSMRLLAMVNLTSNLPITYTWTPPQYLSCANCPNPTTRLLTKNTRIAITVKDGKGCVATDSFLVDVKKDYGVFFPTIFSPNNDGLNDVFGVFTNAAVKSVRNFKIYNRWGNLIFSKNELTPNMISDGWDGQVMGRDAPIGTYIFFSEVEFLDGVVERYRGEVNLTR
jgi:gliding motility-associated-like protein